MFGLHKLGIMGINQRNLDLIAEYNPRQNYPSADSKLRTKELATSVGIGVPELIHVIHWQYEVKKAETIVEQNFPCVIKPEHGSGGEGIIVIADHLPIGFRKASGDVINNQDIRFHCQNILSGKYSLGNQPDSALIETMIEFDPVFEDIAYKGVPDVRIIVLEGKPLMAMLRLPTKKSDGKANLHKGGLGVGIDMETGKTNFAVQFNRYLDRHPETGHLLANREIPYWKEMIDIAVKIQMVSGLGYIGCDIVLDKHKGPLLLEINARPGISIQIANKCGLLSRIHPSKL